MLYVFKDLLFWQFFQSSKEKPAYFQNTGKQPADDPHIRSKKGSGFVSWIPFRILKKILFILRVSALPYGGCSVHNPRSRIQGSQRNRRACVRGTYA